MKTNLFSPGIASLSFLLWVIVSPAQVETDKPIILTGADGERYVTGLELPVNGVDATNKDYVDAAVSASGGGFHLSTFGNGSLPTMMSDESSTTMTFFPVIDYCRSLVEGGHDDWRIPTVEEVIYLRASDAHYPNIPNPTASNWFWAYSMAGGGDAYHAFAFHFGAQTAGRMSSWTSGPYRARCVR